MFTINDDLSIYATRGDTVFFTVTAEENGVPYYFEAGDVLRMKIYGKKDAESVVLEKDFPVTARTDKFTILLTEEDTKIGEVISKPVDYWYEIELNPYTNPQTIIGYDDDGAKIFKLFPEGADSEEPEVDPEDIPVVDIELDMTSPRPVQNQAIARAVVNLEAAIKVTEQEVVANTKNTSNKVAQVEEKIDAEKARIDNLVSSPSPNDAELIDIRVGVDGKVYASAGTAVREQISLLSGETNALKTTLAIDLMYGSVTNGEDEETTARVRFVNKVKANKSVVHMVANDAYYYGYSVYDENGIFDGVDHGWNPMDGKPIRINSGYFKMNFRKAENGTMSYDDMAALKNYVYISQYTLLEDVEQIRNDMAEGATLIAPYELELGTFSDGEKNYHTGRCRFVEMVEVNEKTEVSVAMDGNYLYGYCFYNENGVYDGVDNDWLSAYNKPVVTFEAKGYVAFNFRRVDDASITEDDIVSISHLLTIKTQKTLLDLDEDIKVLEERVKSISPTNTAINSINVEYGREKGASYVFVRIPKATNEGKTLSPKLHLTSVDGSVDGSKVSALAFAKRSNPIFTMNAGLFNTTNMQPVGQTIIDGVSYVNTPMVDDMGSPISEQECYPLCIDANGNLSAPYTRNVDTSDMIADGVVYAVTGWGKVVDNFKPCSDTVDNEIVHAETYIRQIIGQFQNGDYFVCTVDKSRGSVENEAGMTYADLAQLLVDKGVKFAYSLDGGGSAETVIGVRQLNPIYEGTAGRAVPTVITFE